MADQGSSPPTGGRGAVLRIGYSDIPSGHIAAIATTLEMLAPPLARSATGPSSIAVRHLLRPDIGWYRRLFRRIGEPWLWHSRLRLSDAALSGILHDPGVMVCTVTDGDDVGLVELDFREEGSCELAFFGLVPERVGLGAGRFMMDRAIAEAWARPIRRFWVHTCTLDHPAALGFYIRSGFTPIKRQLELAVDPRLDGTLAREAAPHVPILT